ncbi:MAG: ABC transporter substrate-binding protein [Candidatus Xiphinematobacter sp.]|nr:MAG: ABC transporter substrate-binding protein [Candidatus Xiphinematobacter sp.]
MTQEYGKGFQEPICIGVFQSLSGTEACFGQDAMIGIQMANDGINAQGGVLIGGKSADVPLRYPIKLIVRDNQSKAGETSAIVRELISRDRVVALIGEVASGRTLEAAPIAQRHRVPLIANAASNDKITQGKDFVFRASYSDSQQGQVVARYVRSLGKSRAAILVDISRDSSTTIADSFQKQFVLLGGRIVAELAYNSGDKNFQAQLTTVKESGADCLFLPGNYTDCATSMKQAQLLEMGLDVFGADGWDATDLIRVAREAAEGAVFVSAFSAEDPDLRVQSFVQRYQRKYGKGERPMTFTVTAFDTLMLLANAMERARVNNPQNLNLRDISELQKFRQAVRNALSETHDYKGISGQITFEKSRDPRKPLVLLRIRNGKFRFLQKVTPE